MTREQMEFYKSCSKSDLYRGDFCKFNAYFKTRGHFYHQSHIFIKFLLLNHIKSYSFKALNNILNDDNKRPLLIRQKKKLKKFEEDVQKVMRTKDVFSTHC